MAFPDVNKTLALLGRRATEKVTQLKGTVTSISFDLFGCVTGCLNPPAIDNKAQTIHMYDINRLDVSDEIVMDPPMYSAEEITAAFALLGKRGTDKISGSSGVVVSIHIDLYGRIELVVSTRSDASSDEKGILVNVQSFTSDGGEPVMVPPTFGDVEPQAYDYGPAEKLIRSETALYAR